VNSRIDAVVVGGGVTGLVAAQELRSRGRQVVVLEPSALGGLIKTRHVDGFTLECGPNVILAKPGIRDFFQSIQLAESIIDPVLSAYRQYVWQGTGPTEVPRRPMALLASQLASPGEKFSIFRGVQAANRLRPAAADESVLTFLGRVFGDRIVFEVVDAAMKGIFGGRVEDLSARSLFPGLWKAAESGKSLIEYQRERKNGGHEAPTIFVLRGGNAELINRLGTLLSDSIMPDRAVSIQPLPGGRNFRIDTAEGRILIASTVIVACPLAQQVSLLSALSGRSLRQLEDVSRAPLAVVHLALRRTDGVLPKDGFGVLFPRGEPSRVLGVMFNSVLFPHMAPLDQHLLTVCIGGVGGEDALLRDDEYLGAQAISLLGRRLRLKGLKPLAVTRWPSAIPQYNLGHHEIVAAVKELEMQHPRLRVISSEIGGIGVPDRVSAALNSVGSLSW
jgi:oxygen-dependent protoporphyrinogen oxidase